MMILATAAQVDQHICRLIRDCVDCQIAVAWASIGFEACDLLAEHKHKVDRLIVGTHFYQTHPAFIENFRSHPNAKFVLNPEGLFHPKVYLFEKAQGDWECLIGSPNFTQPAFANNDEMAVLLTARDHDSNEALAKIKEAISGYWQAAKRMSEEEFVAYKEMWKLKQPVLRNLQGKFGPKTSRADRGMGPLDVPILRMTWETYFEKVRSEKLPDSLEGRLRVIRATRSLFGENQHFNRIGQHGRKQIAGLVEERDVNYLWFGSMKGAGYFKQAINNNDENLSLALDVIPSAGQLVSREMFLEYTSRYQRAFPNGHHGIATATRLLTMKRPDTFVCLDSRNKIGLCSAFGISQTISYEAYWDSIVERIRDSVWWNSPRPQPDLEREVWDARAAFLDSLYYEHPKGVPLP